MFCKDTGKYLSCSHYCDYTGHHTPVLSAPGKPPGCRQHSGLPCVQRPERKTISFIHLNWEAQVTTIHVACVHQGGSLCTTGMFLPLLWMCPAVRRGDPAPVSPLFFCCLGVNLNNVAVQTAVLSFLLSLINVVRHSLLHQESVLIKDLLASHLVWTPSLPIQKPFLQGRCWNHLFLGLTDC